MCPGPIVQEDLVLSIYVLYYLRHHRMPYTDIWRMKSIPVISRGRRPVVRHDKSSAFSC